MTAALKNRVRPVVGSLALGSTLVLSGCVTDSRGSVRDRTLPVRWTTGRFAPPWRTSRR